MTTLKRILCPVDFSEGSRHALDLALALAKESGAELRAVHVLQPVPALVPFTDPLAHPPGLWAPEDVESVRKDLQTFVAGEGTGSGVRVDAACLEGNPAREILRDAESTPADLIVLGTHGRSGFTRLLLGSVTEKVLRHAPCPVLTVPPRAPDAVPAGARVFSRIVVAVDFSDTSQRALKEAIALCRQYGAALTVVHVVEPVPTYAESGIPGLDADIEREAAYGYLKGLIERLAPGFQAEQVVLIGHAGKGVLRTAESAKADLIVAGVHGRNAMDLMFFGSTANRLVREAVCPVLTLKS